MKISVIVPIYNEAKTISRLVDKISQNLKGEDFEIILTDDGSVDSSAEVIAEQADKFSFVKAIILNKNYGQTAALAAGIDVASGEVIVLIDGDLENDPADIPRLLEKITEGYDIVSGWRKDRWQGHFFTRKIPSQIANWLISRVAGFKLHDHGCTLKAYKASVLKNVSLYGEMHRFITAYAYWQGAKIIELPVAYKPRQYGQSHYGLGRIWRVVLDLITLKFLSGYATKPLHIFGLAGLVSILLGLAAGILAVYFKLSELHHKDLIQTPLPVIMTMLIVVGVMFIMMGLMAEILMRTYHESQNKPIYHIKKRINIG